MEATSKRGTTGYLHRSSLRSLLLRANLSSRSLSSEMLESILQSVEQADELMELPGSSSGQLTRKHCRQHLQLLDAWQICGLFLRLSISSLDITELFERFAVNQQMGEDEWLRFVRSEQLPCEGSSDPAASSVAAAPEADELVEARQRFERESSLVHESIAFGPSHFAAQLLNPRNQAVAPARSSHASELLREPLAQYFIACSHK